MTQKPKKKLIQTYFILNSFLKFTEESKYQIKDNFFDSIKFTSSLSEEDRYSYHIQILLHFNPIKHYINLDLLKSACDYTKKTMFQRS